VLHFAFVWLVRTLQEEVLFTILTGALVILLQVVLLTRYVMQLARVLEKFIDSMGRLNASEIQFSTRETPFKGLKAKSNVIQENVRSGRLEQVRHTQILEYVINATDIGLLCFYESGALLFMNQAARNLLSEKSVQTMDEIRQVNENLWKSLTTATPDYPHVSRFETGRQGSTGHPHALLFSVRLKEVLILGEGYRLFSLQNIQEELHRNEADSWQKIIRVLTHEIMNAVAPMLSMTKSMKKNLTGNREPDLAKFMESLNVIESTGEGLIGFTDHYRRLSLLPPPVKDSLNIRDALGRILLLMEEEAHSMGIGISLSFGDQEAVIQADKQQFEMMLVNLLKNAFDALREREGNRTVEISVRSSGTRTLLRVEDNGTGIDEKLTEQVFVPFFSTKEEGSGIGLSLVRQIMNNHGGSVYLESEAGIKTSVTLAFAGSNTSGHPPGH